MIGLDTLMLMMHVALCAVIFWTCFCRQARSTHRTRPQIRAAFWLLAVGALVLGAAPWAPALWDWPHYYPTWPVLLLQAAVAHVQLATAHYWRRGVPDSFARWPAQ
jgi:hypothetical protein